MSRRLYGLLLRLLPSRRRARFGHDMLDLFEQLRQHERRDRGPVAATILSVRDLAGVVRFILREWAGIVRAWLPGSGPGIANEARWVLHGIQSRGWSAALTVTLLAGAIGATGTTFLVADSLVFNPHPFPHADRIVRLEQFVEPDRRPGRMASADLHDEWRRHRDVFSAVGGHLTKIGVFLTDDASSEQVSTADITIELLDVLGVRPAWGRAFSEADLANDDTYATLVSEVFARQRFGSPDAALGQRLDATGRPLVIVGVMAHAFAFPSAGTEIWRLMDPRGPLTTNFGGVGLMARVAPGMPIDEIDNATRTRAAGVGAAIALPRYEAGSRPYFARSVQQAAAARDGERLLMLLLGAGVSLLLISSANVASLELAHVVRRSHAQAVRCALGASRVLLARLAALEGLVIVGAALLISIGITTFLLELIAPLFPASFARGSQNPIDVDYRVLGFSTLAAAAAWLLVSIPAVVFTAVPQALAPAQRTTPSDRALLRHQLTVVQVALAVSLVIVGLMYSRSYRELIALDKGFDSTGVAMVSVAMPANYFSADADRETMTTQLLDEVRRLPSVLAASRSALPPFAGDSPMSTSLSIDGRQRRDEIGMGQNVVDPDYFTVTGLPLLAGRPLQPGEPWTNVLIPESFARMFWVDGDAVGGTIRGGEQSWFRETMTVVGVVGDFRRAATRMTDQRDPLFVYRLRTAPPPRAAAGADASSFVDSGGSFSFLTISVRVDTSDALLAVQAAVQRMDPRLAVTLQLVDDNYARQNAHILLASRAIGAFSLVSFAIAMAGLYGVLAFVVAGRTREIGIRMALGAAATDIRRMVLATSGRMVVVGAAAGVAMAFGVARWVESQLFGVSPSDPATYLVVVAAVSATAVVATWAPVRKAAATDPAITLRAE